MTAPTSGSWGMGTLLHGERVLLRLRFPIKSESNADCSLSWRCGATCPAVSWTPVPSSLTGSLKLHGTPTATSYGQLPLPTLQSLNPNPSQGPFLPMAGHTIGAHFPAHLASVAVASQCAGQSSPLTPSLWSSGSAVNTGQGAETSLGRPQWLGLCRGQRPLLSA